MIISLSKHNGMNSIIVFEITYESYKLQTLFKTSSDILDLYNPATWSI